jgi:hypothetical protein
MYRKVLHVQLTLLLKAEDGDGDVDDAGACDDWTTSG